MEVRLPKIMGRETDAVLTRWHAEDGARVQEGDLLYELEVPKITTSKTAPASGTLYRRVEEGARVRYGMVLAVIEN